MMNIFVEKIMSFSWVKFPLKDNKMGSCTVFTLTRTAKLFSKGTLPRATSYIRV